MLLLVDAESSLTFAFAINFTTDTRETNENTNMITSNFLILSLFRFNVDCTLAESFYGKNEGLFSGGGGAGGEGGSCPSVSPLPPGSCEGSVSTCWSPGQPDGDCPNFGLCCFDGCANTCPGGDSFNTF